MLVTAAEVVGINEIAMNVVITLDHSNYCVTLYISSINNPWSKTGAGTGDVCPRFFLPLSWPLKPDCPMMRWLFVELCCRVAAAGS